MIAMPKTNQIATDADDVYRTAIHTSSEKFAVLNEYLIYQKRQTAGINGIPFPCYQSGLGGVAR
jgi:hypothetical protein